jgi:NADP-dependent aldehyde dehydrogenase
LFGSLNLDSIKKEHTMLQSLNARTGQAFGEALVSTTTDELNRCVQAAAQAFESWQSSTAQARADLLNALALALENDRTALVELADTETGLGSPRLNGELDRTAFQLRRFATLALDGAAFAYTDDPAVAGAPPAGHPAMMRVQLPLGVVAMFCASNFPFAFSVLGGDTASALAAGCSVVIKAHPGHAHTCARVFALVQATLQQLHLPAGLVQQVQGAQHELGSQLVQHPRIAAVAFTGSTKGGLALNTLAQQRPRPIPFYGELGAINPVVATPQALAQGGEALAQTLAGSITLGCGQFCTNPGLLVFQRGATSEQFVQQLTQALSSQQPHVMLTPGMRQALDKGIEHQRLAGAQALLHTPVQDASPRPYLAQVDAATFIQNNVLHEEVFGPASLIVWTDSVAQTLQVLDAIGGSLTVTLWCAQDDSVDARALVRGAMHIAGRVLFAGVPTGVAVTAAQQHGGPWPASTQPMTTSVGDAALARFLRPVALQDMPTWLQQQLGRPC